MVTGKEWGTLKIGPSSVWVGHPPKEGHRLRSEG